MESFIQLLVVYYFLPTSFLTLPVPNERHLNTTSTDKINFLQKVKEGWYFIGAIPGQTQVGTLVHKWDNLVSLWVEHLLGGEGSATRSVKLVLKCQTSHKKTLAAEKNILHIFLWLITTWPFSQSVSHFLCYLIQWYPMNFTEVALLDGYLTYIEANQKPVHSIEPLRDFLQVS